MSSISDFTGKFKLPKSTQSTTPNKVQRRPRESAVCKQCRTSKLRCDRSKPACGNCLKKDAADQCLYDNSVNRQPTTKNQALAEDRLAHLEFLVKQLIQEQSVPKTEEEVNSTALLTPVKSPERAISTHSEQTTSNESDYVGFTHWSAILDEIDGLKAELSDHLVAQDDIASPSSSVTAVCTESIFGSPATYSLRQTISEFLPDKVETDRLLSIYFQGENFILAFIHTIHFQAQYWQFWANPNSVNPLWLSILFSIIHLGSLARDGRQSSIQLEGEGSPAECSYHTAAGRCLVIGEYHRPQEFVVEALLLYAHCKSILSLDPQRETGVIHSMAVRNAYQLGYHRDPDLFKKLTPFQGEMRRRTWSVCKQLDLMTSFQLGLPSSICLENCDTKHIKNLRDTDFGPKSKEIPPSRPDDEVTRLLWFVVKDRQMVSFAKVCRDALSHNEKSEAEVRELDQEIRQMHESIPTVCKVRPMADSIEDDPFIIITRIYLDFISQKSFCVLHRRYMARGNHFSTVSCLNASKAIVVTFIEMYHEFAPGGRLYTLRWMLGCYTMNDFLLGTTVLCLFLHTQSSRASCDQAQIDHIVHLLKESQIICLEKSDASKDAYRVAQIVQHTLRNISSNYAPTTTEQPDDSNASLKSSTWDADIETLDTNNLSTITAWDNDAFDLFQPYSFTENGMTDMDWAIFDPSMSVPST